MPEADRKNRNCLICQKNFLPRSGIHKYCSETCKGKAKYIYGRETTETQYQKISGNWSRYFGRLIQKGRRGKLTSEVLLTLLEKQKGKCALSGIELTCILEKGIRVKTNASIDRIIPGKEYTPENIQLICSALNTWRSDTDLDEFIWFCKKVTEYQQEK